MRFLLFLFLLSPALFSSAAAHAPEHHKFRLVTFRRPLPAPAFELAGPSGKAVRLADLRGKVVLLNFWATWCPPCVREMPSMEALYGKYRGRNFEVVAVSLDERGAAVVMPFLERLKLTFQVALDPDGEVSAVYGARDLPSSFLIDPAGNVIAAAKGERDWFSPGARSYMDELIAGYERRTAKD
jgi:peroxiredoxin